MNDTPASDEIDLTELFSTLWNAKWLIFLVTAGAVFATAVLLSVSALQKNDTKYVQSYVDITGITDAQYPNGMSFSPTDLTSSDIVSRLLEAYPALDLETMSESIRAEYGHPGSRALRSEWNAALKQAQDNDASIEQIQELNQTYQNELTRLNSGSISISITHRALGVNEATAISIAQDLPRMWQTVFVEKHKVALPPAIANIDTRNVPKDIASTSDLFLIQLYVERLKRALGVAMETPRLATLQSPSGYNAEQLLFDADRFLNFQLNPVMAAELKQNDPLVQSRLRMLDLEKRRLESIKANVSQSINELTTLQNASVGRVNGQHGSNEAQSSQLALNEDALSSVINLAQKAQLNDYLVELFTKSDDLATQLADIDMEVGKLTFERFEGVTIDVSQITGQLNSLITEFDLLMDVWTNESLRASQEMYKVAVPAQRYGNELEFNDRSALMLALATVLGLFVAMAIALIRAAVRQKDKAA